METPETPFFQYNRTGIIVNNQIHINFIDSNTPKKILDNVIELSKYEWMTKELLIEFIERMVEKHHMKLKK